MRVLLVTHVAPPHIGGVESVVAMEAAAFRDAGHEVVWVTSDAGGDGTPLPEDARLRVVRVRAWHLLERWFGIAYPLFSPLLPLVLWREVGRADLVHVHGLVFPGSPLAALFARLRGRRCLCTDHGGLLQYPSRIATGLLRVLMATMGRVTARSAHKLIALNHDVEALLARLAGTAAKVQFLPNPVDVAMFQPPTMKQRRAARERLGWDDRPRVLCVSRLLPHKGVDVLLAAQHPAFELVFCGPGDDAMRQHIRAGGATCLDPRPREQILALYHASDVFALPSHNEGFPVVIQEALACGLPVVTSDLPAYAPYRGTPGLHLCEPEPNAVQRRILHLLAQGREPAGRRQERDQERARWLDRLLAEGAA
ncbi:MAG TPA: glycosyltransferase family 1 protein [bacterium]|nr:glycosyltransferase family 1 protein [bacterium]